MNGQMNSHDRSTAEQHCGFRSVLIAQPVHQHAYETALAAQSADLLHSFVTGLYYAPSLRKAVSKLPRRVAQAVDAQFRRRFHPLLDPARVRVIGPFHAIATPVRLASTRFGIGAGNGARIEYWAHRRFDTASASLLRTLDDVRIVHGFQGASVDLFVEAKTRGLVTVLDAASAYEWHAKAILTETGRAHAWPGLERVRASRELADVILAPSDYVKDCLVQHGVPPQKVLRLPYGVNVDAFTPSATSRNGRPFRVAFLGSITRAKGIQYLLEAWSGLAIRDAELVLVGQPQPDALSVLREFKGTFRWVPQVPKHAVPRLLGECDLLVLPSLSDGWPLAVGEALSSAVPVITTTTTGFPVRDGIDGFVVPPRESTPIAERIEWLYERPELRARMGAQGRERVLAEYTWPHYQQRLATVYHRILQDSLPVSNSRAEMMSAA